MGERKLINGKEDSKVKEINGAHYKYCPKCKKYKPMTDEFFHKNKNLSTGYDSYCKECKKLLRSEYTRYKEIDSNGNLYCLSCKTYKPLSEFSKTPGHNPKRGEYHINCNDCMQLKSNPLKSHISKIIYECNYTKSKYKREYEVLINIEDILNLYEEQNHRCALTGLELTYSKDDTHTNLSIDRINPGKDYSIDNIRLVCKTVNIMRNSLSDEEFIKWCNLVVLHNEND